MSPRQRVWLACAAALALGVYGFLELFEKRSFEFEVGFHGEAAANRYLAAQRLLERMGLEVRSLKLGELGALPPHNGTLILPTERATLSRERARLLERWVNEGGHLIVVTWTLWDQEDRPDDPLLDPLGFRQFAQLEDVESMLSLAVVPGQDRPLAVMYDPRFRFEDSEGRASWSIEDANGTHLLQTRLARGTLTALTDDLFMTNYTIAEHDHAELVCRLARADGRTGPVWIVFAEEWPGPWQLLWEAGWAVVVALALLVCAWIWMRSRRFGPLLPDPSLDRRSLMEHIEASGRFHWKHAGARMLADATREALMERVRTRHPGWLELSPAELAERLEQTADVPLWRINRALAFRPELVPEHFAQDIATMEQITRGL